MSESGDEKPDCRRIEFHGRVQGVGFRMTTASIAKRYEVVGYVKNLPAGTVEIVVEGRSTEIDRFLGDIQERFQGNISECVIEKSVQSQEFRKFSVRYF